MFILLLLVFHLLQIHATLISKCPTKAHFGNGDILVATATLLEATIRQNIPVSISLEHTWGDNITMTTEEGGNCRDTQKHKHSNTLLQMVWFLAVKGTEYGVINSYNLLGMVCVFCLF